MAAKGEAPRDPVRRWTLIILGVIVALYLYSIIADRMTPYTSQATVQAFIVRMAPEVSGRVQEVLVDRQSEGQSRRRSLSHRPSDLRDRVETSRRASGQRWTDDWREHGRSSCGAGAADRGAGQARARHRAIESHAGACEEGCLFRGQEGSRRQGNRSRRGQRARGRRRSWSARVRNSAQRETTIRNFAKRSRRSSKPSSILSERRLSLPPMASSPICSLPTASMLTSVRPL